MAIFESFGVFTHRIGNCAGTRYCGGGGGDGGGSGAGGGGGEIGRRRNDHRGVVGRRPDRKSVV